MQKGFAKACFTYTRGQLTGHDLARLIEAGIWFRPTHIRIRPPIMRNGRCNILERLDELRACDDLEMIVLHTAEGDVEGQNLFYTTWPNCSVLWLNLRYENMPDGSFFVALTNLPGFNAGYIADAEDDYWQNADTVNNYELYNRSYRHLRVIKSPPFDRIDISRNPGHRFRAPGMLVASAWKMWFSPAVAEFLPLEKALTFQAVYQSKRLDNGVIFVNLYPDIGSYDAPASRRVQKAFRKWMDMPKLEKRAPKLLANLPSDPVYEFRTGKLKGKPVMLLITWLDDTGQHARRSKATQRWMALKERKGKTLWTCIQSPPFSEIEFSDVPPGNADKA